MREAIARRAIRRRAVLDRDSLDTTAVSSYHPDGGSIVDAAVRSKGGGWSET